MSRPNRQADIDFNTIFIVICLLLLLWGISYFGKDAADQLRDFTAECTALKGEVAKQQSHVICVDPNHVLKEMNGNHKHAQ